MGACCQSSPESGARAGWSGHKRRKGSKVQAAVETLGHLLALVVTPANVDERTQVEVLATEVQAVTGETVELAYVDEGHSGPKPEAAAEAQGIRLEVVSLPEAKRGFVLLPRRWVVERTQPHYQQPARDVQERAAQYWARRAAEPPACRNATASSSGPGLPGRWCAMSGVTAADAARSFLTASGVRAEPSDPAASGPPRPRRRRR